MPLISMQVIKPTLQYTGIPRKLAGNIAAALNTTRQDGLKLLALTSQTWRRKPKYVAQFSYAGGDIRIVMTANPSTIGGRHWHILDRGSTYRYVRLSHDWRSKTAPGRLAATAGRGRVIGRGKFPGIEPRDFSGQVQRILYPRFVERIDRAIERGLK